MKAHCRIVLSALIFLLILVHQAQAAASAPAWVPGALREWVGWALHGKEEQACPPLHVDPAIRVCAWPSSLALDLHDRGGSFSQAWDLQVDGWAALPGDASRWPEDVAVDGQKGAVTLSDGTPRIRLSPGHHLVKGAFRWKGLPEALPVPPASGIITLTLNGTPVELPAFEPQGRLWLQRKASGEAVEERLDADVSRLVRDTIPLQVVTRLRLRVSGQVRELTFPRFVSPEVIPVALDSDLPSRIEPDGGLRVQVRPGEWTVTVGVRHRGPVTKLRSEPPAVPWPQEEVWSFEAQNHLRIVEAGGTASPVDPQQTTIPEEWRKFPAFLVRPGQELTLKEIRRGDPQPAPDRLTLERTAWLSMEGSSLIFRDEIGGVKNGGWRLEINEPLDAGRVTVDGQEQFITRQKGSRRAGIELRQGTVRMTAESTMPRKGRRIPAVGWEQDFAEAKGTLNLPPGWRLIALTGADRTTNTWIAGWTLLDLFMVLIFSLAAWHLWGRGCGILALVTLALTWHEPSSPSWLWAPFLASTALARAIPSERARAVFRMAVRVFLAAIVAMSLPYVVGEARRGIYPQLSYPGAVRPLAPTAGAPKKAAQQVADQTVNQMAEPASPAPAEQERDKLSLGGEISRSVGSRYVQKQMPLSLPNAAIQTGRGLPEWQWDMVHFSWNGPVRRDERLTLYLVGPRMNFVLSFVRILLLTALLLVVSGFRPRPGAFHKAAAAAMILVACLAPALSSAADLPDRETLDELAKRLLEPPECFPNCAQVQHLRVEASPSRLLLEMEIHAAAEVAVPLPSNPEQWMPSQVIADGGPARGVLRRDGGLWLLVPKGISRINMAGPLPRLETVLLPLPVKPHRAEAVLTGWTVDGIHADGRVDGQLQLTRISGAAAPTGEIQAAALPPLVAVERTLVLGLDWTVETVVRRVGPPGSAVVIAVPLLAGESVTMEGVRSEDGKVLVSMGPAQESVAWTSLLKENPEVTMTSPATDAWFEVWRLDASPIWHVETSGIPVVHHLTDDRWLPEWRPWPGEKLALAISRPEGVPGQTTTIDRSSLSLSPGARSTESLLTLTLRSSQGGQQTIGLPPGAQLLDVKLNGATQPIRAEGGRVPIPVSPGSQQVDLRWNTPAGMGVSFRPVQPNLAIPSVNSTIGVKVPGNRWIVLAGGPVLGPAVVFWGVMVGIVLAALILGRVPGSPLGTLSWILLGVGLSQAHPAAAFLVVGWLLALRGRRELDPSVSAATYNMVQTLMALLTVLALGSLVAAISQGLLGYPDLYIAGNGSNGHLLRWYSDHGQATLPGVWAVTAPLWLYRMLMLAWSLWIAFALLRWLRYGWESFSRGGLWREIPRTPPLPGPPPVPPDSPEPPRG